ncbi:MAG: ribosome maturation factor RimM [Lachnospiraceae bacterium]|nr:ribosome maturation factor RimM [Lachnospiraceae bacterium]
MEENFKIGEIVDAHGVRGEVKIYPTTEDVKRYKKLKECELRPKRGENMPLHFQQVKFFKQYAIVKFQEINDMDEALKYKHAELYVDRAHATPLYEDEFYVADLIGIKVYDGEDSYLGELKDVLLTGANDVYVVDLAEDRVVPGDAKHKPQKEVLIPAIKDCIKNIDVENARMDVVLMPGLLKESN